jgi:pyruvate/2-oxoacid:ferredoxin oxidoreductase beta subunit
MPTKVLDMPTEEYVLPGNRACAGCGIGIGLRAITKALGQNMAMTVPASCLTVLGGMYPTSSVSVPWVNVCFPGTAAAATGLAAGLRATGRGDVTVLAMAGDGGTADIGIQGLSGAAERNADFIYLCYDNEAYMNTGTQRSGMTPLGARTTTTPALGKTEFAKDMPRIMEAHDIPYVASTSAVFPADVYDKVAKARDIHGTRYIHMNTPCPSGWGFDPKDTVSIGKMAVDTGQIVLYEVENGAFRLTGRSASLAKSGKRVPVADYLATQSRFRGIDSDTIEAMQHWIDERWERCLERDAGACG